MPDVIVSPEAPSAPPPASAPAVPSPRPGSIEALVAAELPLDDAPRPGGERWLKHPPRDLFGVALSGGGIRSATFNLGLLQGLQDMRVLRAFDYLSTVSGGGYLGAFWTAWRHRQPGREGTFPSELGAGNAEPPEVRHLREFSNFLSPRLGIFSYDTGRLAVTALGSMLPSALAALSVIALAILLWTSAVWVLFSPGAPAWAATLLMDGGTLAALVLFELAWLRRKEPSDGRAYLPASLLGLGLTAAAWYAADYWWLPTDPYLAGQRLPDLRADQAWTDWRYVLAPAAAWFAALQVLLFGRWLFSSWAATPGGLRFRRAADRVRSRLLLLAALWTGVALLWYAGVLLESWIVPGAQVAIPGLGGLTAILATAFAKAQHLLAKDKTAGSGGGLLARLKPVLPQVLAWAVVLLMVMAVVGLIVAGERPGGLRFPPAYVAGGALAVVLLVLFFMDPNEVGLHSFYRARLVRAYPGASNGRPGSENRETEVVPLDDVRMDALANGAARPFHLVCCTANDLASKDAMAGLYRGAKCAVLSRVGCSVDGTWAPWGEYRTVPTLGGAITASGAAFNTLMGSLSIRLGPAVTFLMATLNLRLGLWVANPGGKRKRKPFPTQGGAFFREMFGRANTTSGYVHLSDGGHFENLAAYELVRRHCRVIVVSDCGQDPECAFDDLGNLVRRVREDFDVEIRIDTGPLKPDGDGLARQHMVAGDIHYPDGDTGLLLLFKPVLAGDEPADVAQYRRRNAAFPNESTGDQFYDEAQWESYRRLGRHAAHAAFRTVMADLDPPRTGADREFWTDAFARARREWQPKPDGFDERLSRFTDRVAELDGLLREGDRALLHQVYKELDELDRRKLPMPGMPVVAEAPADPAADGEDADPAGVVHVELREAGGAPRIEELSTSLHLVRRALLLMAEIFESEKLEANSGHPLYLGVMNWFARWAYAPLFRMWWPLLKTMYPEPFTRFLEKHFNLVSIDRAKSAGPAAPGEQAFTWIDHGADGFARTCWLVAGREIPSDREVLSYNLRMVYEQRQQYRIQAAQLIAQRDGAVLVWKVSDFFVPPGLWGIGIGGDFLDTLRESRHNDLPGVEHLVVKVSSDAHAGAAARKQAANEMQLYRTAGFREADLAGGTLFVGKLTVPLPPEWAAGDLSGTQWMVATVV